VYTLANNLPRFLSGRSLANKISQHCMHESGLRVQAIAIKYTCRIKRRLKSCVQALADGIKWLETVCPVTATKAGSMSADRRCSCKYLLRLSLAGQPALAPAPLQ
jgi:hypothetical protein